MGRSDRRPHRRTIVSSEEDEQENVRRSSRLGSGKKDYRPSTEEEEESELEEVQETKTRSNNNNSNRHRTLKARETFSESELSQSDHSSGDDDRNRRRSGDSNDGFRYPRRNSHAPPADPYFQSIGLLDLSRNQNPYGSSSQRPLSREERYKLREERSGEIWQAFPTSSSRRDRSRRFDKQEGLSRDKKLSSLSDKRDHFDSSSESDDSRSSDSHHGGPLDSTDDDEGDRIDKSILESN